MGINTLPNTVTSFGNPYPGEASIMETIHHHKLQQLERQFAQTAMVGGDAAAPNDIYMNRGVNDQGYNTG